MQTESGVCFSYLVFFNLRLEDIKGFYSKDQLRVGVWTQCLIFVFEKVERLLWKLVFSSVTKFLFQLKSGIFSFLCMAGPAAAQIL